MADRCSVHPQRRVIGICAHCLQERLTLLIESINPEDAVGAEDVRQTGADAEQKRPPLPPTRPHSSSRGRSESNIIHNPKASAEMAFHSHAKLEDSLNVALRKVKQAHQQLSYVAQSPYQGVIKVGPDALPLPNRQNEKHVSTPASCRQSNASESDMQLFPLSGKRRNSWFSISRGKSSLLNSPMLQNANKLDDKNGSQKSPQVMVLAGRKSASDAIGHSCSNSYRQAYMAELESIAEINLGEAAMKVEPNESNGDAYANPSWISSLFQRRKGSRYKQDERQDAGMNYAAVGNKVAALAPNVSANRSPLPSFEAGRLSWDGPRPSFKQMLKRMEARKKQQRVDCSPLHSLATTNGGNEFLEDLMTTPGQAVSALQKCKTVAASKRSTNIDIPKSSSKQASSVSPMLYSNENVQTEYGNGDVIDREPRSWGRAWNRTLSPLLGFRNNGRRGGALDSGHQHPGYATPNHVNFKSSLGAPPLHEPSFKEPMCS